MTANKSPHHQQSGRGKGGLTPASGSPLRRTGPSSQQTIQVSAHVENDSATPKPGLPDRTTESSSQPSTGVVIFDPGKCPSQPFHTAIRGSEQRVSGGGTPNRCRETDSHATLRHSFFQAIGAIRGALTAAHSAPAFLSFCSSFLSLCLSPAFHKEISCLDHLETTIANSVGPLHPRFSLSLCAFPFPRVDRCRHLIASKEVLPFSDLRYTAFPAVSSASSHRQRFRSESPLVDPDLARI
jgi:hypothetical protein